MPLFIMSPGTREFLQWMAERDAKHRRVLARRLAYGGKKGRAAARRLRRMGPPVWNEPERIIAYLYGREWARPPYGFAATTPKDNQP